MCLIMRCFAVASFEACSAIVLWCRCNWRIDWKRQIRGGRCMLCSWSIEEERRVRKKDVGSTSAAKVNSKNPKEEIFGIQFRNKNECGVSACDINTHESKLLHLHLQLAIPYRYSFQSLQLFHSKSLHHVASHDTQCLHFWSRQAASTCRTTTLDKITQIPSFSIWSPLCRIIFRSSKIYNLESQEFESPQRRVPRFSWWQH